MKRSTKTVASAFLSGGIFTILLYRTNATQTVDISETIIKEIKLKSPTTNLNNKDLQETFVATPSKAEESHNKPKYLTEEEESSFFEEVIAKFAHTEVSLDKDLNRILLMKLNSRGKQGVRSCIRFLERVPEDTDVYWQRRPIMEYLGYRLAWDEKAREAVAQYIGTSTGTIYKPNVRALHVFERVELLKELAKNDKDRALRVLSYIDPRDEVFMLYARENVVTGLTAGGMDETNAYVLADSVISTL